MADLFDVNAAGAGFHITSHMIAIIALFVACFAITGYITFRDDSIGAEKLKEGADDYTVTTVDVSLPVRTATAANFVDYQIVQPANSSLLALNGYVDNSFTTGVTGTTLSLGTTAGGVNLMNGGAAVTLSAGTLFVLGDGAALTTLLAGTNGVVYTATQRTITLRLSYNATTTITAGGSFKFVAQFVHA